MNEFKITFLVGDDFTLAEKATDSTALVLPNIGDTVQVGISGTPPLELPVKAIRHIFIDGEQRIEVLLFDQDAANQKNIDNWIKAMGD